MHKFKNNIWSCFIGSYCESQKKMTKVLTGTRELGKNMHAILKITLGLV